MNENTWFMYLERGILDKLPYASTESALIVVQNRKFNALHAAMTVHIKASYSKYDMLKA